MDSSITVGLHAIAVAQPWLAILAVLMADYGLVLLPVALLVIWLSTSETDRRQAVLAGGLAALVAISLALLLERTLARPRPFVALGIDSLIPHAADSSFPSDHTLFGVALVGPLALRMTPVGLLLLGWALLVGVARVAAALHYPSDILGSALLALMLDGVVLLLVPRLLVILPAWVCQRLGLDPVPRPRT